MAARKDHNMGEYTEDRRATTRRYRQVAPTVLIQNKTPKTILRQPPGCIFSYKNTRFHPNFSLVGARGGAMPYSVDTKGRYPSEFLRGNLQPLCIAEIFPSLSRPFGGRIPFGGRGPMLYFLRRLYSERGFMTSRQSRSPRSSAMTSTSAVAMLVATGMLYRSHMRSSSCSVSS